MDLRNLETTTTYAIQAVYLEYWRLIPERYRLFEKAQPTAKPSQPTHKPLSYKQVEQNGRPPRPEQDADGVPYDKYCCMLNSGKWFDLEPFYDPQLDFETGRTHYKIAGINFPDRQHTWFIITWNMGQGLLNSSLTRRRFQSASTKDAAGNDVSFDFINTDLELNFAIYSNRLQGLMELQENIIVGKREKCTVETLTHSILGKFPVSLDTINSSVSKMPRSMGTLCTLNLNIRIDYPIIGNVKMSPTGIIKEIHTEIDGVADITALSDPHPEITGFTHEVLARDIINENTPDYRI